MAKLFVFVHPHGDKCPVEAEGASHENIAILQIVNLPKLTLSQCHQILMFYLSSF